MQTIYLDISNKGVIPCIQAKQSEVGRKFLAVITDNGVPYNIPIDALLSVWYEGDTDAGNYSSIEEKSAFEIDGNKVTVELVAQMLLKPGKGELCLSITHGDGGETNTWNIPYCVEYKPGSSSAIPTEYYTALTEAGAIAAEQAGIAREQAQLIKDVADKLVGLENILVPVGYTFNWSPVDGNPMDLSTPEKVAEHFGFGVWEQINGRFLLGASEEYPVNSIGGEAKHTMTIEEMPTHTHRSILYAPYSEEQYNYFGINFTVGNSALSAENPEGSGIAFEGGGKPQNNMPPYLAVYIWKRVA